MNETKKKEYSRFILCRIPYSQKYHLSRFFMESLTERI